MPVPTIFLINGNGEIVELSDQPYDSERLLQELLAKYPNVLAGDQMGGGAPVKWLLVAREAGIPDATDGVERWSLDHIFLDQNAIPTLVEVKRSTDTRIRREVVGQMLDYAANAVLHWPLETIRQRFEETCRERELESQIVVANFLGVNGSANGEAAIARFWDAVETNLRAGKIRLIFAADVIPPELKRVVEFLNEQMSPAEVVAIEIRQYVGTGIRTLVPSVIRSAKRLSTPEDRMSVQWTEGAFVAALLERRGSEILSIASNVLNWAKAHGGIFWWGEGRKDGSCFVGMPKEKITYYPFAMWTYGRIEMQFKLLRQLGVSPVLVENLASKLNLIPGIAISPDSLAKRPAFEMGVLKDSQYLSQFLDAIDWFVDQIR
jgi:hypothetical protein